jgi:hypothetical protein
MKIESSNVAMVSQSSYKEATKSTESLKVWGSQGGSTMKITPSDKGMDTFVLSEQAKTLQQSSSTSVSTLSSTDDDTSSLPSKDELQISLLEKMIEALTGKKFKFKLPKKVDLENPQMDRVIKNAYATRSPVAQQNQSVGWGLEYNKNVTHYEAEQVDFRTQAAVTTADGREINVDLQLSLSREFASQSNLSIRAGDAAKQVDPLVINYDAPSASVTQQKYAFDIDANGTMDQISFVGPGSGFLALDSNNDGKINDGSELFGPQSGNGFADLAKYDADGNNWIDENDPVYEKLQIWSKDAKGNDVLMALGQKGVGAIYLGNVSTSFALKGDNNQTNAQLQRTGFYLNEDGSAGTVQHIDLAI